jgi:hypothetical protein
MHAEHAKAITRTRGYYASRCADRGRAVCLCSGRRSGTQTRSASYDAGADDEHLLQGSERAALTLRIFFSDPDPQVARAMWSDWGGMERKSWRWGKPMRGDEEGGCEMKVGVPRPHAVMLVFILSRRRPRGSERLPQSPHLRAARLPNRCRALWSAEGTDPDATR